MFRNSLVAIAGLIEVRLVHSKRMKKVNSVELTLRVAREGKASEWMLEGEAGLDKPVDLLVNDVEVAMMIATRVDEQQMNH